MAYITKGEKLISQRRGNASYFYHYDGLGSTKALTDANQNIQASYKYDAWGNILQTSGTVTNPYLYVGELGYYSDGEAGMYLLTQRWYNPVIGRFVVRDPVVGLGFYIYCKNRAPNIADPIGFMTATECVTLCGAIRDAVEKLCKAGCAKEKDELCEALGATAYAVCIYWCLSNVSPTPVTPPEASQPRPSCYFICTFEPAPGGGVGFFCGWVCRF